MKRLIAALFILSPFAAPAAMAESPILIELFASQNCRACPKAHATLKDVEAERDDILILTWSVDYWDYLGRKDPMAMAESKERQRAYVDRFRLRGPYTPQTVYNGVEQCPGNRPRKVESAISKARKETPDGVHLVRKGDGVELSGKAKDLTDIWYVDYLDGADNTTDMVHPVTRVTALGPWLGGRTTVSLPPCDSHCAVIVQDAGFGPVLATLPLNPLPRDPLAEK
nr:DUF1223 domain-containing protein [uncultured Hyphomonas sp.]